MKLAILALFGIFVLCDASIINQKCRKIPPIKDFDLKKFTGDWYFFIASKGLPVENYDCARSTVSIKNDDTIEIIQSWFDRNGNARRVIEEAGYSSKYPGIISSDIEDEVKGFFDTEKKTFLVQTSVLDTDYENYFVTYACYIIDHAFIAERKEVFSISLRNRNVDLRKILPALGELRVKHRVDLNEIQFANQTAQCTN